MQPPVRNAGPEAKERVRPQVPSHPKQHYDLDAGSWSLDTAEQRDETVGLEEPLASMPVGRLLYNHQFVTSGAPAHNTIASFSMTHEVKDSQSEVYQA